MIFQELITKFNDRYYNQPLAKEDVYESDGESKIISLTSVPLACNAPYKPVIVFNSVTLVEGTDYSIDYEQGKVYLNSAGTLGQTATINYYQQKANLKQLVNYYNRTTVKVGPFFPRQLLEAIDYTDVVGANADDTITEIDINEEPYSDWQDFQEILQNKNDYRTQNFMRRGDKLLFSMNNTSNGTSFGAGPFATDYLASITRGRQTAERSSLKYPFYIKGNKKYIKLPTTYANWNDVLTEVIEYPELAEDQILVMMGIYMYQTLQYLNEVLNAASLRRQKGAELYNSIRTLQFALQDNIRNEAFGKGEYSHTRQFFNPPSANVK